MKFGAVILAAGYSSRMDSFKPLMHIGGKSLLGHCISLFRSVDVNEITVVTGCRHEEVAGEALLYDACPVYNPDFDDGMFSSVCAGINMFETAMGIFVLPVDIPLVRPITVETLLSSFTGDTVVYPFRDGVQGHPPLIPGQAVPAILKHDGRGGLRKILRQLPGQDIPVWDDGPFMDADARKDFDKLCRHWNSRTTGTRKEAETLAAMLMPPRGVAHGKAVAEIATVLAGALNSKGYFLNLESIYNGALLHDIAKGCPDHEAEGGRMMRQLGLTELSDIVASHRDAMPRFENQITERELVCLADKLVRGTFRMSIRQRFEEKLELYRDDADAVRAIEQRLNNALALQQAVENVLLLSIDELLLTCTFSDQLAP